MKKTIITCLCLSMFISVNSFANQKNTESKEKIRILKKNTLPKSKADSTNFTGEVILNRIFPTGDSSELSAGIVEFEVGSRTNWHSHPKGQMLIITSGKGWIQEWGDPILEVQEGDIVWFPAGIKHWHGASPDTSMTHIAISPVYEGKSSKWMERVSQRQYKNNF